MGVGPFSSESTANQTTQTVSGSGQLNEKSHVAQGGSLLLDKGAKIAGLDLSKASLKDGSSLTINQGPSDDLLKGLVGTLTQASTQQTGQSSDNTAALAAGLKDLASQKSDSEAGNPRTIGWIAAAGFAALALFAFNRK